MRAFIGRPPPPRYQAGALYFRTMSLWLRVVFVTGAPDEARELVERHRETVRALAGRGTIRVACELGRGDGFVEIFEARDRREAEEATRALPLTEAGLGPTILREIEPGTLLLPD
jgi:hypothetical protein